jgi:hypothetical protein
MVHIFKRRKKPDLDSIDNIASEYGWRVLWKAEGRDYIKGNLKIRFIKTKAGYKVMLFKNIELRDTDITKDKNLAFAYLGEALIYRVW